MDADEALVTGRAWSTAGVALAAWLGGSAAAAWFVLHPWTWPVRPHHVPHGCAAEEVAFVSSDLVGLSGWLFAPEQPRGAVVLCHGAFENRLGVIDCVPPLVERGYAVLVFDFRARGLSRGGCSTIGWRETDDVLAAVQTVRRLRPELPLALMGYSMGAAASLMAAAREPDIAAVIADSSYDRLDRAMDQHLRTFFGPTAPVLGAPGRALVVRGMGVDPATVSPLDEAPQLAGRPVLLIHCTGDLMCESAGSERLAAAIGPSAELWMVRYWRHTKARRKVPQEYWQRVGEFLDRAFGEQA